MAADGSDDGSTATPRRRRARGEPRRLILNAARELFDRKGYSSTSTREIAELAGVSETLIFRYFKTKAGLFSDAMVRPFVEVIDGWIERLSDEPTRGEVTREDTQAFVGDLYDVFREHRALAALVFATDALAESELAATGAIDQVRASIDRFVGFARDEAIAGGADLSPQAHDLAIRGHFAMVASIATLGPWYFGKRPPSRKAVVEELSEWVLLRYGAARSRRTSSGR